MNSEIASLLAVQSDNREIVERINNINAKVNSSEQTKVFLDNISKRTGQWYRNLEKISEFTGEFKNLWINKLKIDKTIPFEIGGYSTHRYILPRLKRSYENAFLEFMHYEPMRDRNVYEFNLKIPAKDEVKNEPENKK
jgi:hypothetical protein